MKDLMIGTAIKDIELEVGMDLTGYLARMDSSKGIHDNLKVRSVIFDDGCSKFLLVICDLLGLSSEFTKEVARLIEQETSITLNNIVIACTHTHSGPASIFLQDCGEVNYNWLNNLKTTILNSVKEAISKLKHSKLSYKTVESEIGFNRTMHNLDEAKKHWDNQVGVLAISDTYTGDIESMIINCACHPVVLDHTNLLYSKDYPHYTEEALKQKFNNANIMFTTGCCGDVNPVKRGSYTIAEELGNQLAASILSIDKAEIDESKFADEIMILESIVVNLPLKHDLSKIGIEELKSGYEKALEDHITKHGEGPATKPYKAFIKWCDRMLEKLHSSSLLNNIAVEIKILTIGKFVLVMLPFEVFHDIGLKIKEYFGKSNTMIICYANADFGYLPSKDRYDKVQYEVDSAYKYYGYPGPFSREAENMLYDAIFRINKK